MKTREEMVLNKIANKKNELWKICEQLSRELDAIDIDKRSFDYDEKWREYNRAYEHWKIYDTVLEDLEGLLSSPEKKEEVKQICEYCRNECEQLYHCDWGWVCSKHSFKNPYLVEKEELTQEQLTFEEYGYLMSRFLYEDSEIYRRVKSKIERLLK